SAETALVSANDVTTAFDLDGNETGQVPGPDACRYIEKGEEIDGRWHPSVVDCTSGPLRPAPFMMSPDDQWFLYRLLTSKGGRGVAPMAQYWVQAVSTGERHLLQETQECGGCDG